MSRNNVRGPTSALTEFLRASGITATTIANRAATRRQAQAQDQSEAQPVAGPSRTANDAEGAVAEGSSSRRTRARRRTSGYASDELDEPEAEAAENDAMDVDEAEEEKPTPAKKRKLTKAAEAKLKAKEKKKKGKKASDDDDDDEEDAYTALSKSMWANSKSKPPVGTFEDCAACGKQFTVTKYTMASNNGDGFLCHQCAKAGGNDPFKKPAAPRKRKAPADKRNVTNFEEKRFPTLVSLCIQLITKHINDVEALGDIGTMNVEAISKALSKNRGLTPENAHLFYNNTNTSLTLFDATNLPSPALETLVYHNPNLVSLRLDFCGHLDDAAFKVFTTSLPSLQRLELLGPFLVRPPSWQEFFKSHIQLEGFLITQSPRLDENCMKALVENCSGIKDLRLKEIGKLDDSFLNQIKLLKSGLRHLDLSDPGKSCSEKAMLALIRAVGKTLAHLNVSKHVDLTDTFLTKGLLLHTKILESLDLSYLPEMTDEGVSALFEGWEANPGLVQLNISRNDILKGASLDAILKHSGETLEELNINGMKEVPEKSLRRIGRATPGLRKLDVGFCRSVDDFVVQDWLEGVLRNENRVGGCRQLEELKVWGCNRVTSSCPKKKGVMILGVESHTSR